jgi:hypothetical protein
MKFFVIAAIAYVMVTFVVSLAIAYSCGGGSNSDVTITHYQKIYHGLLLLLLMYIGFSQKDKRYFYLAIPILVILYFLFQN